MQVIGNAMDCGIESGKKKKQKTVQVLKKGLGVGGVGGQAPSAQRKKARVNGIAAAAAAAEGEEEAEDEEEAERPTQKDPLRGKIREALSEEYLERVMRW